MTDTITLNGNGKLKPASREDVRQMKRDNAYMREQIKHRGLARASKLMESFNNYDWVTVYSDMLDRFRNPEVGGGSIATTNDRHLGKSYPMFQNETDLARLRMPSRILCATNNYAIGLLGGLTSYVIGTGYDYRATPRKGVEKRCPQELADACQLILDDFGTINRWKGGEQPAIEDECFWRSCEDGEFLLRLFPQDDGRTFVRTLEPEQLTAMPGGDYAEWSFGVHTPENDAQDVRGYYVFYGTDPTKGQEVCPDEIVHLRRNVKRSIKRGMPDFTFDTYDALAAASKLRRACGIGAAIQASIAWVRQHETASADEVNEMVTTLSDWSATNPTTGKTEKNQKVEPGTVVDMDKGTTYVAPPSAGTNGTAHLAILEMLAVAGGIRWNAPPWLSSGQNSSANYATALTEESPFVRTIQRAQTGYKAAFVRPYWFALEHYIKTKGRIVVGIKTDAGVAQKAYTWDEVKQLIDIQVEAHSPEVRNKMEEAQANAIRVQGGWKSPQTVQAEEGLDSAREEANIAEWREKMGGQGAGLQLPEAGGGSPFGDAGNPQRPTTESRRLREAKDASGHEHAADGRFGSGGGSAKSDDTGAPAATEKPKHAGAHGVADAMVDAVTTSKSRAELANRMKSIGKEAKVKIKQSTKDAVKSTRSELGLDSATSQIVNEHMVDFANDLIGEVSHETNYTIKQLKGGESKAQIDEVMSTAGESLGPDGVKKSFEFNAKYLHEELGGGERANKIVASLGKNLGIDGYSTSNVRESFDESKVKRDGGKFAKQAGSHAKDAHAKNQEQQKKKSDDQPADAPTPDTSTLNKIADTGKKVLAGALDLEHGAKEFVKDKFDTLPNAVKAPVAGFLKVFYGTYVVAQDAVDRVATAQGMDEKGRHRLASVVCAIDAVGMKANAVIGGALAGPAAATAASFVPIGSVGYLAFTAMSNPAIVMDGCKAAVKDYFKRKPKAEPVKESKDASGHEHAKDGKFGSGGTKKGEDGNGKLSPREQAIADGKRLAAKAPEGETNREQALRAYMHVDKRPDTPAFNDKHRQYVEYTVEELLQNETDKWADENGKDAKDIGRTYMPSEGMGETTQFWVGERDAPVMVNIGKNGTQVITNDASARMDSVTLPKYLEDDELRYRLAVAMGHSYSKEDFAKYGKPKDWKIRDAAQKGKSDGAK